MTHNDVSYIDSRPAITRVRIERIDDDGIVTSVINGELYRGSVIVDDNGVLSIFGTLNPDTQPVETYAEQELEAVQPAPVRAKASRRRAPKAEAAK